MDQNFRFSINGFNRSDVVRYLEYLNGKHTAKVNQLTMDNEMLRQELASVKSSVQEDDSEELREQLEAVTAERDALAQRVRALEEELSSASAAESVIIPAAAESAAVPAASEFGPMQELEAYRRAESMEREARERARRVRLHMQQVIADAGSRVDAAASDCDSVAAQASAKLSSLIDALSEGRRLLHDAADELRNIELD